MEENNVSCKVVIVGGSAGSLDALMKIFPDLNTGISFALILVLHRKSSEDNTLEELIALKTAIPVKEVEDKTPLEAGSIYIAPADYHLLFENDATLSLDTSEKVNYSRPSIDVSFESAAAIYGPALTGILLSGANTDGTAGLIALQQAGGIVIVQDPASAEMPFMPNNAIENVVGATVLDTMSICKFINAVNK